MTIRAPKDFWSGIMFIAFAAVALVAAQGYSLGKAGKMGPGYFPMLLGGALLLVGAILVVRSLFIDGERIAKLHLLPLFVIAIGVVLFGVAIDPLGLVAALVAVTVISVAASRQSGPVEAFALAAALAAFSVGIFVYALRLPLPIWPSFLAG